MYQRGDSRKDEPMEMNAQKIWRRNRTPSESMGSLGSLESDGDIEEPKSSRDIGDSSRRGDGRRQVSAGRRERAEA